MESLGETKPSNARGRFGAVVAAAAVFLLVAIAGIKLDLARSEDSLWMDEVYSLEMASFDLPRLLDQAVQDLHPPLYYLTLRGWLLLTSRLSIVQSVGVARAPSLLAWLVLVAISWRVLRRALGRAWGSAGALLVAGSAHLVEFTQEARGYSIAVVGTTVCLLVVALDTLDDDAPSSAARARSVIAYVLAGSLAAWTHLLSWPLLALIGASWLTLAWRFHRDRRRRWYLEPLLANAAIALGASPWLGVALRQASSLRETTPWNTAPSLVNLGRVFWEWLPFGRDGYAALPVPSRLAFAAGLFALMPLVTLLAVPHRARAQQSACDRRERELALACAAIAFFFIALLWGLTRVGWLSLFHGPRYPCMAVGPWVLALLFAAHRISNVPRRSRLGALALLPWLMASGAALWSSEASTRPRLSNAFRREASSLADGAELPLFHTPTELTPFLRHTLSELGSRSVAGLPCELRHGSAILLDLNRWRELDRLEAAKLHAAMATGVIGALATRSIPGEIYNFQLVRLASPEGGNPLLEAWCEEALRGTTGAVASREPSAPPEGQRFREGWSYLEFDRHLRPFRWTRASRALLRFSESVPAGRYVVHLSGATRRPRSENERLAVSTLAGEELFDQPLAPGGFAISFEWKVAGASQDREALVLRHATREITVGGSDTAAFRREIGLKLWEATLERLPDS